MLLEGTAKSRHPSHAHHFSSPVPMCFQNKLWETDFYTPQVLGGTAILDNSAPAVYKIQGP